MLSYTCKTAIKAVIYLASKFESNSRESVREISSAIEASEHTVGKLLQTLVRQQVIHSTKGPSGGFHLDKKQMHQPAINIVFAIDGKTIFKECGLGLNKCSEIHPCPIHFQYKEARDIIENIFRDKKIFQLADVVDAGKSFLNNTKN
ncbi:Rrf2 family transcriptional regulator [soil metagenome]